MIKAIFRWIGKGGQLATILGIIIFLTALGLGIVTRFVPKAPIQVKNERIQETNTRVGYMLDIEYPEITHLPDAQSQYVNSQIKAIITSAIDNFTSQSQALATTGRKAPFQSKLQVTYQTFQITPQALSILFTFSDLIPGLSHPLIQTAVYNYSFRAHKEITLDNLFNQETGYVQAISLRIQKNLPPQFQKEATPIKSNFKNFVLTNKEIIFIFDPSEASTSSAQIQEVKVPYITFKDYFAK